MLLRATYVIGDVLQKFDFVGEGADREFTQWLVETAKENEKFQYLGSQRINNPVCWHYNGQGCLEVWDGLLPIGEPGMIIRDNSDIEWFFEKYLKIPMGDVHVDDTDICENPGSWFLKNYAEYDDIIMLSDEIEEQGIRRDQEQKEVEQPMSAFEIWFRTFIEEKDLPVVNWEIEHDGNLHMIDNYDMVEIICELPSENQRQIKDKLVAIDFMNGDVNHFLKYLAKGYIMTHF